MKRNILKILISGLVTVLPTFNAWAEPGGTYTLTGKEKSIAEIIKVDMEKYPELYQGETLKFYILKFKQENSIEKRKLSPGDTLRFPVTRASIKAKKSKAEEVKKQKERLVSENINSFTKKRETDWLPESEFDELVEKIDRKGYWQDQYWVTGIDGRYINGKIEYKLKYEPAPDDGSRYEFVWTYGETKEHFEKEKETQKKNGMKLVSEQSFVGPDGDVLFQGAWHMVD